ncbi:carbon-nitrogen hydrolase family protein [Desulfofundulus thermobenzoicus]|uniref:Carbon-nitrogen hydrolase family protein n=1 Tax=Desulfofundulus thermobenzoicus TaxID=29376 RepID=A0A6N7IM78_9FIRM|nr:carbon-nitrogen hydrolase family protein [Desulfofundulus thermobenzoicus]MQL50729.1 carbon-nitrogen hydrolase family protein [Desulfofundulus thermobenzoicus]
MGSRFILALAQAGAVLYDKDQNIKKAEFLMSEAAAKGARAILFPEMFLTGYMVWDKVTELAESLDGQLIKKLSVLARRFNLMTICGFPEVNPGFLPYNSACIIDADGTVLGAYRKTHLFGNELKYFTPGGDIPVINTSIGKVGVMICYDSEFPEVARVLALQGARLILSPTANMDPYSKYQSVYLKARAMENGVFVAIANTVGTDGTFRFFGQSGVADPTGHLLCFGGSGEELLYAQIDFSLVPPRDEGLRYLEHRRPQIYHRLIQKL